MKKLAIIAALVIAFTSMTYAQKQGTATITANAKIVQGLVVGSPSGPLNFGDAMNTIVLGAIATTDTSIELGSDARAVDFSVTGDGGTSVAVTYGATGTLTSGSNSLTFTPAIAWTPAATQTGETAVASGGSFSLGGSSYSAGTRYIWLGGKIATVTGTTVPGLYTGTFVITVAYSGN